ncbi:GIY-YIG nuclease family protein [Chryseobacterium sp.]|uniref:GIY-YIG nuclease family protein n=1 Tax=Chryseobacterium sp. TaxID=1871047 RepID=UPI00388D2B73
MKTLGSHNYYTYILTNKNKTVLYVGITNDLQIRLQQHFDPKINTNSFTSKYKCYFLVYYEHFSEVELAIAREKQIKGWSRKKKEELIILSNPNWEFLNDSIK